MLSSKIPVMAKNWIKLSFLLIALATNPSDCFGVGTPAEAAEEVDGAMPLLF